MTDLSLPTDYLLALADAILAACEAADEQRAKGTVAGLNCSACGDALGDNLGPECPSCIDYLKDFPE